MSVLKFNLRSIFSTSIPGGLKITLNGLSESFHTSSLNHKWNVFHLCKPTAVRSNFRRKIYYPEKYTVEPLKNDHLAGRDPNTGKVVHDSYHSLDYFMNNHNFHSQVVLLLPNLVVV